MLHLRRDEKAMDARRQAAAQGSPLGKFCNAADTLYHHNPPGRGSKGHRAVLFTVLKLQDVDSTADPAPTLRVKQHRLAHVKRKRRDFARRARVLGLHPRSDPGAIDLHLQ